MPRIRPPHLQRETTRHGKVVWFVRVGKGPRTRLRAAYGTPEFDAEYKAAVDGAPPQAAAPAAATKSLAWLIARYRETSAWAALSPATRRQRENIFKHVLETAGAKPYAVISREHIAAGRDRRAATPAQARNFLDAMRGLFRWAAEAGFRKDDPTLAVKNPKKKKGPGFPIWTEEDAGAYERRWPIGTRQRVWFDVLCYTGGRRGDAVKIGKQHVRDGVASFRTEKSGQTVTVTIPILPVLARTLEAGPVGDLAFIVGAMGHPLTKETFGNDFSKAARAAGVRKSAHGVRKIAATRAANAGATVSELNAIFGWKGSAMASLYTQEADRRRLAMQSAHKLENTEQTATPAPDEKVRAAAAKTK
jgi:integrase